MICIGCEQVLKESDTDFFSLFVGLATILITIYVVYLGKKVEIKTNKFNKLCLEPLEVKFKILEDLYISNRDDELNKHLKDINDHVNDLCLLLAETKEIYPKLDINVLQDISHEFTDFAFQQKTEKLHATKSLFLKTKVKILSRVYDFALDKEINIFHR